MSITTDPVAIIAPPDTDPARLHALARYAVTEGRAPVVLHGSAMPWLNNHLVPASSECVRTLLGMVARHSGGRLWVLLDKNGDWPRWAQGSIREWRQAAGRKPSRIRHGTWAAWESAMVVAVVVALGS